MGKECYVPRNFSASSLKTINSANSIIAEYLADGYDLTLRQLYYQFVSRDLIPNKQSEYKKLGSIINDARLAGLIDWDSITDRTRNLVGLTHWVSPTQIIDAAARGFRIDRWENQPFRVEIWIEKDALAGVFERVCEKNDVPYFSCRGYTSQSEMYSASQRLLSYEGQKSIILHFGDHDPSGIDMSRDIEERLHTFLCPVEVRRIALNMDQVKKYKPPPNPAKDTDSRFTGYISKYGTKSWELDALDPKVLNNLAQKEIDKIRVKSLWDEKCNYEDSEKEVLTSVSDRWYEVTEFLREN